MKLNENIAKIENKYVPFNPCTVHTKQPCLTTFTIKDTPYVFQFHKQYVYMPTGSSKYMAFLLLRLVTFSKSSDDNRHVTQVLT